MRTQKSKELLEVDYLNPQYTADAQNEVTTKKKRGRPRLTEEQLQEREKDNLFAKDLSKLVKDEYHQLELDEEAQKQQKRYELEKQADKLISYKNPKKERMGYGLIGIAPKKNPELKGWLMPDLQKDYTKTMTRGSGKLRNFFHPSQEFMNKATELYFTRGGKVTKIYVDNKTQINVWGDFVKKKVPSKGRISKGRHEGEYRANLPEENIVDIIHEKDKEGKSMDLELFDEGFEIPN